MNDDRAFDLAQQLISDLPCIRGAIEFWDLPLVSSDFERRRWHDTSGQLEAISREVSSDKASYFLTWASDAAVGAGDLNRGLTLLPVPTVGSRASLAASSILDLKLALGLYPNARDMTALFGPKVTAFGKENLLDIERHIQIKLDIRASKGDPVRIDNWTSDAHIHKGGYSLFSGHPSYLVTRPPAGYHFNYSKKAEKECVDLIRDAENTWREERDLPRVGEGWLSETRLFYDIKAAFLNEEVLQHYSPTWLGRQHLDIALPSTRIAIEYQGAQHDQPIAFFGGEEAFLRSQERDRRKLRKCRQRGWRVIYVREGYSLSAVIADVRTRS